MMNNPPNTLHPMYEYKSAMYPIVCNNPLHSTFRNSMRSPTRCASSCM